MSCFTVQVLEPSGKIIEVEVQAGTNIYTTTLENYSVPSIELTECVAQLPSDFNDRIFAVITGEIVASTGISSSVSGNKLYLNSIINQGSGLSIVHNSGIYTISASGLASENHKHLSTDITDFNSSVSGLIPVKNIVASTGINVSSVSGTYTILCTGSGVLADQAKSIVTTVFNKTGGPIPKMTAVHINGGQGDLPTITPALANQDATSAATYGLVYNTIQNMESGQVIVFGALTGVDTDQFNPTSPHGNVNGEILYLSPTISGGLTTTKPSAPNHIVSIGTIVRTQKNEGVIEVRIQNGFELEELHNVAISGVSNGQFLQYNASNQLWIPSSSGNFSTLTINGSGISLNGHSHTASSITDFNSSVSGLLPVKNILAGSGISINSISGEYTVAVTGNFGLTSEQVDDRVNDLLIAGNYINLNYDDNANSLVVSVTGLQPSGNYSIVGHSHISSDITNFDSSVSGLLPVTNILSGNNISISQSGTIFTVAITGSLGLTTEEVDDRVSNLLVAGTGIYINYNDGGDSLTIAVTGMQPSGNYSLVGHSHTTSDITNFSSDVSGLLPITSVAGGSNITVSQSGTIFTVAVTGSLGLTTEEVDDRVSSLLVSGSYVSLNYDDNANTLTIGVTGLQPSGNYSLVGHSHTTSDITNFDSAVSGLLPSGITIGSTFISLDGSTNSLVGLTSISGTSSISPTTLYYCVIDGGSP